MACRNPNTMRVRQAKQRSVPGHPPNKGLELTAKSVRSFVAPAFGSSSGLALGSGFRCLGPSSYRSSGSLLEIYATCLSSKPLSSQ